MIYVECWLNSRLSQSHSELLYTQAVVAIEAAATAATAAAAFSRETEKIAMRAPLVAKMAIGIAAEIIANEAVENTVADMIAAFDATISTPLATPDLEIERLPGPPTNVPPGAIDIGSSDSDSDFSASEEETSDEDEQAVEEAREERRKPLLSEIVMPSWENVVYDRAEWAAMLGRIDIQAQ